MYRGRYQQGSSIPLGIQCRDGNRAPIAPTEAPWMDVWSGTAKVASRQIPALDAGAVTGKFAFWLFLGASLPAGKYTVVYKYRQGSSSFLASDCFEVLPGGSPEGAVLALVEFLLPQAQYLVHQLDSGKLKRGRNPRL